MNACVGLPGKFVERKGRESESEKNERKGEVETVREGEKNNNYHPKTAVQPLWFQFLLPFGELSRRTSNLPFRVRLFWGMSL